VAALGQPRVAEVGARTKKRTTCTDHSPHYTGAVVMAQPGVGPLEAVGWQQVPAGVPSPGHFKIDIAYGVRPSHIFYYALVTAISTESGSNASKMPV
jgi:hypothetical protein